MIVLVCGGRDFNNKTLLDQTLDRLDQERKIIGLLHGAARGADTLAGLWMEGKIREEYQTCWLRRQACPKAYRTGLQYHPERWCLGYPANWDRDKKAAGPIRNRLMLNRHPGINLVVAFPTGGRGTANMLEQAAARGVPTHVVS